jgi:hypothetical protein
MAASINDISTETGDEWHYAIVNAEARALLVLSVPKTVRRGRNMVLFVLLIATTRNERLCAMETKGSRSYPVGIFVHLTKC